MSADTTPRPAAPSAVEAHAAPAAAPSLLRLDRRSAASMLLGAVLYGVLSWVTNIFPIATGAGIDIRPGVAVPLFFGFVAGPLVGFVTGMLGNVLGDTLSGSIQLRPDSPSGSPLLDLVRATNLNWQVGNGLLGLVTGLSALVSRRYRTWRDQLRALLVTAVAVVVGIGFAAFTDPLLGTAADVVAAYRESFVPGVAVDLVSAVLLVPLLLFNYERLELGPARPLSSGLVRQLVVVILIAAAVPVLLLGMFLFQERATGAGGADAQQLTARLLLTVVATLALAVANALLMALSLSRPLLRLTDAARAIRAGRFSAEQAGALQATAERDELGVLSQLFGHMAQEVIQREQALRQQIQALEIEIDQSRKARDVAQVTGSEYFRQLRSRARDVRARGRSDAPPPDPEP